MVEHPWSETLALLDERAEHRALVDARLAHVVEVRQPLVLISQVRRSGGTLLSQLFDGHPECHAHPHELKIGHPRKVDWPRLDLDRPSEWFSVLRERRPAKDLVRGYRKSPRDDGDVFPFVFSPLLQEAVFEQMIERRPPERARDVLDAYMTSYFNAWLDNHNLYVGPKKVVTGFTPQLVTRARSVDAFFADYPDGTLISIVREPHAWYESLRRREGGTLDLDTAIGEWRKGVGAVLDAHARYPDRVAVITYEQLVRDAPATTARLAARIGISNRDELLTPTFNGRRIRANSSDPVSRYGILPERASAHRETLDPGAAERIDELAGDAYVRAADAARAQP